MARGGAFQFSTVYKTMPYRQSDTRVGAPAKPSARSVSKAVGNAMAAPCGMRTRYNRPLRRLIRPDVMRAHDSFRPSPGRSPRTHLIHFPVWARHSVWCRVQSQRAMARGRSISIFYRVEDDAVLTVRYSCWRSSEAQRPECVQSGGKCDGRPVRDAYTVQPAAAPPDQTRCHEGPRFISTVPRQEPPHSPDSFSRVGPPFCVVSSAEPTCDGSRAEHFNFLPCRRRCRTDSQILVLALQRSPAPGVCPKRWEMRWPPRAGCVHGTTGRCAA